jgi:hypothetical protein
MTDIKQGTELVTAAQTQDNIAVKAARRREALSPELREVLHMLKSLEAELDARQATAR